MHARPRETGEKVLGAAFGRIIAIWVYVGHVHGMEGKIAFRMQLFEVATPRGIAAFRTVGCPR